MFPSLINEIDSDIALDIKNTKSILTDLIGKEVSYGVNKIIIDEVIEKNGHFTIWVNGYSKKYGKKLSDAMYFANNLMQVVKHEIAKPIEVISKRKINTTEVIVESQDAYKKEFSLARKTRGVHAIPRSQQKMLDLDFKDERFRIKNEVERFSLAKLKWNNKIIRIESCSYFRDANDYPSISFNLSVGKSLHFPIKAAIRFINSLERVDGILINKIKEPQSTKKEIAITQKIETISEILSKLSSIVHLYVGCDFEYKKDGNVHQDVIKCLDGQKNIYGKNESLVVQFKHIDRDVRLILKHLSDMEENEKDEYYSLCKRFMDSNKRVRYTSDTPQSLLYATSLGYDVFNLIENNYAIDASTFNQK